MGLRLALAAGMAVLVSGCASFDGIQEPVIKADAAVELVSRSYGLDTTLTQIARETDKAAYRNRVLSIWLMAIDARYDAFRRDLSRGRKGSAVGLDILTLGLTSAGSVITDASQELAAAATGVGGARASVDRELYFEKTLPVLISYMDAERLKLRGQIIQGMGRPITEYPLEQGFADLWQYQGAGSLDRAIGNAAHDAGDAIEEAEYEYSQAVDLCLPQGEAAATRRRLGRALQADLNSEDATTRAAARARLAAAARLGGMEGAVAATSEAQIEEQGQAALDHLRGLCTATALGTFERTVFGGG